MNPLQYLGDKATGAWDSVFNDWYDTGNTVTGQEVLVMVSTVAEAKDWSAQTEAAVIDALVSADGYQAEAESDPSWYELAADEVLSIAGDADGADKLADAIRGRGPQAQDELDRDVSERSGLAIVSNTAQASLEDAAAVGDRVGDLAETVTRSPARILGLTGLLIAGIGAAAYAFGGRR